MTETGFQLSTAKRQLRESEAAVSRDEGRLEGLEQQLIKTREAIKLGQENLDVLAEVAEVLQQIEVLKREEIQRKVENLVTFGLRSVFKENLTFRIDSSSRAKQSTMNFRVVTQVGSDEIDTDVYSAHGGGLIQVIALLLRVVVLLFVRPAPRRLLILDESLAHLSREYLEPAAELLSQLSNKLDLQILMVTHSPEFIDFADKVYKFSQDKQRRTHVELVS